ncbi:MAG: cupin domain-containing protein [Chloroflexota bacterium]|nr:cupin domain-containing protein [Chloroflexota bacterium]
MRIEKADGTIPKGWYLGPWNSDLNISVGFANEGVDEPHLHRRMTEIYFMARGMVEMRVGVKSVVLDENDVIIVEPGEAHTFLFTSPDHFHFVIQVPGLQDKAAQADKVLVPRAYLGLE